MRQLRCRFYTAGKDNFIRAWARESQMAGGGGGKSGAPKKKKVYAEFVLKEIMQGHKGKMLRPSWGCERPRGRSDS